MARCFWPAEQFWSSPRLHRQHRTAAQVTWARNPSEIWCRGPAGDSEIERIERKFKHRFGLDLLGMLGVGARGWAPWNPCCRCAARSSAGFQSLHRKCWKHSRLWGQSSLARTPGCRCCQACQLWCWFSCAHAAGWSFLWKSTPGWGSLDLFGRHRLASGAA